MKIQYQFYLRILLLEICLFGVWLKHQLKHALIKNEATEIKKSKVKKKSLIFLMIFFLPTIQFLQLQTTTLTARGVYFLLSEIKIERFFSSDNDHDDVDDNVVYVEDKLH